MFCSGQFGLASNYWRNTAHLLSIDVIRHRETDVTIRAVTCAAREVGGGDNLASLCRAGYDLHSTNSAESSPEKR